MIRISARLSTYRPAQAILFPLLILCVFILLGFGIHEALKQNSLGADFYIFWRAGRAFFLEGANPYSAELTHEIQLAIYGRPALPTEDPMAFNYPPYVLIAILPNIFMPYDWAQAYWMALNLVCLMVVFGLIFQSSQKWVLVSIPFLYNIAFGIILGNFSILINLVLSIFIGYFVLSQKNDRRIQIITGCLLAWCTAKPQVVWLYMVFILLFCWRHQLKALVRSFFASVAGLVVLPFLFQPEWVIRWIGQLSIYANYTNHNRAVAPLYSFLQPALPAGVMLHHLYLLVNSITLLVAIFFLYRWWRGKFSDFAMCIVVSIVTYLTLPNNTSAEQVTLLLPFILWCVWYSTSRPAAILWWSILFLFSYLALFMGLVSSFSIGLALGSLFVVLIWVFWLGFQKKPV